MAHVNVHLKVHGRCLLMEQVLDQGRPVAHTTTELGVSGQYAHRWVTRFRAEGELGLQGDSSSPHRLPRRTSERLEAQVAALWREQRRGWDWIGGAVGGGSAHSVLDPAPPPGSLPAAVRPLSGEVIRALKTTASSYEHP